MEETKRRVRKATLIIVGTLIVFAAFTVWVSDTPAHFDESNTYVYEGTYPVLIAALCANYGGEQLSFTHYVLMMGRNLSSIPAVKLTCWTNRKDMT